MTIINEKIYIGSVDAPTLSFDQNNIEDIICNNSVDLIGNELSSDVLEVSVFFDDANKVLENISYATPIYYFSNDALVGKYYINEVERRGIKKYRIRSTSLIGLIEKEEFYGGFYSGNTFSNVVDDILFTNGVNLTKYKLYTTITHNDYGNYTTPVKVMSASPSTDFWLYRHHLEFTYNGDYRSTSGSAPYSTIAGRDTNGGYFVRITSYQTSRGNLKSSLYVQYNGRLYALSGNHGVGSRYVIDIDPVARTVFISVDYVDPDNPAITGHDENSWNNLVVPTGVNAFALNYAFGGISNGNGTSPLRYSAILIWDKFQLYDQNGDLFIDAVFATNEDGSIHYVANTVSGTVVSTSAFNPYGDSYGTVADFSRIERDKELSDSIIYNESVENIPVTGWIKDGTRRDALHQLLFAENVSMIKSGNGQILFTKLSTARDGSIADDYLYDDSSEKIMTATKKINVTEHSYETNGVTSETIFDNTSSITPSGQYIVLFDKAPIFGTPVGSGITIIAHNCNAALVTGKGTITGTPYIHSKNVLQYISSFEDGKDVSVSNVGLITSINSDSIMNKLKSYYCGNLKTISNSIKYNGERCGLVYAFRTMFATNNVAHLAKFNAQVSSFVKAKCEFIAGYVPQGSSGYTDFAIIATGSSWTVPSDIRSQEYPTIRLNIIGKGHDGTAGSRGEAGSRGSYGEGTLPGGAGGAGGDAGTGGAGGNIYSLAIDVTNVNSISVSGSGYNTTVSTYDDNGTLINTYSSSSGLPSDSGFMNIFTGVYYARKGRDGVKGGDGGQGGYVTVSTSSGMNIIKGVSGGDVSPYTGGSSFDCVITYEYGVFGTIIEYQSYGGGGGAAYGANGGNASRRDLNIGIETYGGNGADAIVPDNVYTEYGSGGFGGHGGGGGGGAGTRTSSAPDEQGTIYYNTYYYYSGGYGQGSSGTPGINGCAIIYY